MSSEDWFTVCRTTGTNGLFPMSVGINIGIWDIAGAVGPWAMSTSHRRNCTESHDIGFQLAWHKPSLDTCNTGDASVETSLTSLTVRTVSLLPPSQRQRKSAAKVLPRMSWGHLRTSEDIWGHHTDLPVEIQHGSNQIKSDQHGWAFRHQSLYCTWPILVFFTWCDVWVWCVPERRIDKADAVGLCSTHAWGSSTIPRWKIPFNQAGDHVGKFACELWRRSSLVILPPLSLSIRYPSFDKGWKSHYPKNKDLCSGYLWLPLGIWAE